MREGVAQRNPRCGGLDKLRGVSAFKHARLRGHLSAQGLQSKPLEPARFYMGERRNEIRKTSKFDLEQCVCQVNFEVVSFVSSELTSSRRSWLRRRRISW